MTSRRRRIGIIHASTNLGLHPGGVEDLGRALLEERLGERLGCPELATLTAGPYNPVRDTMTHIYNGPAIAAYSYRLAAIVREAIENRVFPLVLGGDCSILLGNLLALENRCGLLFIDGHTDCYEPAASTGEVAELELGYALGLTPGALSELGDTRPLIQASDVVVFGPRDREESGWRPAPAEALTIDLAELRRTGVEDGIDRTLERLCGDELSGFWIHLDVDVLDDEIMPAVDYRLPDGLSCAELARTLRAAMATGRALGAEVTIFNPALDAKRRIRRTLVDGLVGSLLQLDHACPRR